MPKVISCDWGTSTFRLRLVDSIRQEILGTVKSNLGISEVHALWKQQEGDEGKRISFYQSIIQDQLNRLEEKVADSLQDLPIVVSGMASSNIGMVELPYKELPFAVNGSDLAFKRMRPTDSLRHEVIVISGTKTANDVMRGEETQLVGCEIHSDEEQVYIFPGTHSKHITVKDQRAIDFKTFMTGEFFQLLAHQSILSKSVQADNQPLNMEMLKRFEEGVAQSIQDQILHAAFLVRTNHLFGNLSIEENYHYLSGLLIGTELKGIAGGSVPLTVVANDTMSTYYVAALKKLGHNNVKAYDVDKALVKGHCIVHELLQDSTY